MNLGLDLTIPNIMSDNAITSGRMTSTAPVLAPSLMSIAAMMMASNV